MTSSRELIEEARAAGTATLAEPSRRLAVLTCMDARIDPWRLLDAGLGEIHVVRNAGGLVTDDAIRSLVISQRILRTRRVDVIMHTQCGLHRLDERSLIRAIRRDDPGSDLSELGSFTDLEAELRRGVERLRSTAALPHRDRIRGHVYDVDSGRLSLIVP